MTRKEFENFLISYGFLGTKNNIEVLNKKLDRLLKAESQQLNKAIVMRSVCEHDFTESCLNRSGEFMYYLCAKCGEQQTDA